MNNPVRINYFKGMSILSAYLILFTTVLPCTNKAYAQVAERYNVGFESVNDLTTRFKPETINFTGVYSNGSSLYFDRPGPQSNWSALTPNVYSFINTKGNKPLRFSDGTVSISQYLNYPGTYRGIRIQTILYLYDPDKKNDEEGSLTNPYVSAWYLHAEWDGTQARGLTVLGGSRHTQSYLALNRPFTQEGVWTPQSLEFHQAPGGGYNIKHTVFGTRSTFVYEDHTDLDLSNCAVALGISYGEFMDGLGYTAHVDNFSINGTQSHFNSDARDFTLPQTIDTVLTSGTMLEKKLDIPYTGKSSHSCIFSIVSQSPELGIEIFPQTAVQINPGENIECTLKVDARETPPGVYKDIQFKIGTECGQFYYIPAVITVLPPEALPQPDLSISAADIALTDYTIDGPAGLDVTIHNNGIADAANVPVSIYHFNELLTTITVSSIGAGERQTIQATIPEVTAGEHLIRIVIDRENTIKEPDETNNEASRILKIGDQPIHSGGILVTATLPKTVYTGSFLNVTGRTIYDILVGGVRNLDYPVKGCALSLKVSDNSVQTWTYNGGHSTKTGDFSQTIQAPSMAGNYTVTITATDQTFTGSRTVSFTVIERPAQPELPPLPPLVYPGSQNNSGSGSWIWTPDGNSAGGSWEWKWETTPPGHIPQPDVSISSEDINFSNTNPDAEEEITIFSEFKYWSPSSNVDAVNVPVNIYVTSPGSQKIKIGGAVIDRITINAPMNGSRSVYTSWKNSQNGIHIVEAEIDPSYKEANMKNNSATRAIIVGTYIPNYGVLSGQVSGPEGGMNNVVIKLYDNSGIIGQTTTSDNGFYMFESLQTGFYTVICSIPEGYASDDPEKTVEILDQKVTTADFFLYIPQPQTPPCPVVAPPRGSGSETWTPGGGSGTGGEGSWTWVPSGSGAGGSWEWKWETTPATPVPQQDISVYSENIHFSKNNPAASEEITIFTELKYWSTSTNTDAVNVPVNVYVTRPGSEKLRIRSTVIDRITVNAPQNGSSFVYANWKNHLDGIYIVETEVDPSYIEPNMTNNAATRAIIVGKYIQNHGVLSGQVTGPVGGMKNVGIELYDDFGMLRYTTTSDNGFYLIDALQAGTYTVKCLVPAGYASDTVSRTIEIIDQQVTTADFKLYIPTVPPVPEIDPLPVLSGECSVDVTVVPTAKDHSGNTINGITDDSVSYTEQGEYTIKWHFTDVYGNTTIQTQAIVVKDNTPPEVEELPVLTGECSVIITTPPAAVDNCVGTITGTTTSSLPLVFDQQGTFPVIWTFSDGHGNSAMQTQVVVVADNIAPVPDLSHLPDISGTGSVNVAVIPTATDNCIGPVSGTTTNPLTYNQPGTYTITWNYSDGHGNNSSQQQNVIVSSDAPIERCISDLAARAKLDKIQLTWTDNGSTVYHVFRSEENGTSGFNEIATISSTYSTYLDEGLTVGKTYWYKVTGDGSCSNSEVVSAVPQNRTTRTR